MNYHKLIQELEESNSWNEELEVEVAQLREQLSVVHVGADEVESLKAKLQEEKAKEKCLWCMNFSQA